MRLHPRASVVRQAKAQFVLELLNSPALKPLTYVERTMVLSEVMGDEVTDYIKYDLRVERHGCQHIKADEYHEGTCWQCEEEQQDDD